MSGLIPIKLAEQAMANLEAELADLKSTADRFKAEVERLHKAGDAMADAVSFAMARTDRQEPKLVQDWNAAKEGKQTK